MTDRQTDRYASLAFQIPVLRVRAKRPPVQLSVGLVVWFSTPEGPLIALFMNVMAFDSDCRKYELRHPTGSIIVIV